ncbi:hypothetical protein HW347_07560 [Zobellia sp. KMM 6746]|uniref:Lipocalin-like domain-containing protein n=2 Tax=Zobellia barbeyronii TaxID=2748009 RepID=A0ABS5WCI4_9FLAO|nr:hypothetical protein [Zobellia barbeyronii]
MSLSIGNQLYAQNSVSDEELGKNLIGTWVYQKNLNGEDSGLAVSNRIKTIVGKHWQITQSDPKTGEVVFHHGGTYTIENGIYTETILFANESTMNLIHQSFMLKIKIEGDTMTQIGEGNQYNEVWKRTE